MSRLHRQKLRALARTGDTPANRSDDRAVVVATETPSAPPESQNVKPSRATPLKRKAVRKSKAKAKRR